jgi:hypothetical protein
MVSFPQAVMIESPVRDLTLVGIFQERGDFAKQLEKSDRLPDSMSYLRRLRASNRNATFYNNRSHPISYASRGVYRNRHADTFAYRRVHFYGRAAY